MINPSFTRGEYWLLAAVAELALPICWLDWTDLEEALNKTGHGMSRSLLIETMRKFFKKGFIIANRFGNWDEYFELLPEQIETALNEKQDKKEHYYRLTEKGGMYWEAFARPNWDFYISAGYELPDDNDIWVGELICANKNHLETYIQSLRYHEYDIVEDTIQWDALNPWNATYWKELPIGHRIRFKCSEKEEDKTLDIPRLDQLWYDNLWCYWR